MGGAMNDCCMKQTTPYCPLCGAELHVPLAGLVAYTHDRVEVLEARQKGYDLKASNSSDDHDDREKYERLAKETASESDKWRQWKLCLIDLIEREQAQKPQPSD